MLFLHPYISWIGSPLFCSSLEPFWLSIEPIRLGKSPASSRVCDRFFIMMLADDEPLRLDLYRSDEEAFAFEEALVWRQFVVLGWGHGVYLVDTKTRKTIRHELESYFGHLYAAANELLVASAEALVRVGEEGAVHWRCGGLGLDGVVVDRVADGTIWGRGEWDPPDGWVDFQVSLHTGERQ